MFDELVAWLETVDAEVICLQEVTRTAHRSGWSTFADGERTLPQRLSLFDDVSAVLTDYTPYFVANDAGPVTDATVSNCVRTSGSRPGCVTTSPSWGSTRGSSIHGSSITRSGMWATVHELL